MSALAHTVLVIAKFAEWIGTRMEFEHLQPQWIIFPVGLAVAALVGPIVPMFEVSSDNHDNNMEANVLMGIFFFSIAYLLWVALFAITLFKVITGHNSDPTKRHGVWVWLASTCVIGLADFAICASKTELFELGEKNMEVCSYNFAGYYFLGIFFLLSFGWSTFTYIGFLGRDKFNKGYWMDCFCIDTVAACSSLFYVLNNFHTSKVLMIMGLSIASIANMVAFLHFIVALIHRRGFFCPLDKWGPISWVKLEHEGFRGVIPVLERTIAATDLDTQKGQNQLELFAANYNLFVTLHKEHTMHDDKVIFSVFNDFFPGHADIAIANHEEERRQIEEKRLLINSLLDFSIEKEERQEILLRLQEDLSELFGELLDHIKIEEDDLQPIARKYMPLELQKQIARECFKLTPAKHWEDIIPFVVTNLPRHKQRVRYLKSLCWSMPERAQQIGAIVYRNVDAIMWERLRLEIPEIIPRGERFWRRYY